MKKNRIFFMLVMVLFASISPTTVKADWLNPNWDIFEEYYGNGPGQISFLDANPYQQGGVFSETLHNGWTTLNSGLNAAYAGKSTMPTNWPLYDGDLTIELKVRDVTNNGLAIYLSGTNDMATTPWQALPYVNALGQGQDTIIDCFNRDIGNIAPEGFSGLAIHTYRFIRESHKSYLYLLDNSTPQLIGELGSGIYWSLTFIEIGTPEGLYHEIEFYHLKVSNGAYIPEPATILLLGLGGLFLRRRKINIY